MTYPWSVWVVPGAGAGRVAVQVIEAPASRYDEGHEMSDAPIVSSVTLMSWSGFALVLVTSKVMAMVEPGATATPGAVLASSPLIDFRRASPVSVAGASTWAYESADWVLGPTGPSS